MSDNVLSETNPGEPDLRLEPIELEEELQRSYLDYAMSVIVGRALPSAQDGLKPVHRRILYSLIDGHGNFGSVDGDAAAAMRYTESRLSPLAMELLRDIDEDTVDFVDNYDGEEQEPDVLPSRFPNLLVNGSSGIAVGMSTNVPPHNLVEMTNAVIACVQDPEITLEEIFKICPGPDFPTGAQIMGVAGIHEAYRTGRGSIRMRAVCEVEEYKSGERIVVTEFPYQVNKANVAIKIAELVNDRRVAGIRDVRDESNREGNRLVIELQRGGNAQ